MRGNSSSPCLEGEAEEEQEGFQFACSSIEEVGIALPVCFKENKGAKRGASF